MNVLTPPTAGPTIGGDTVVRALSEIADSHGGSSFLRLVLGDGRTEEHSFGEVYERSCRWTRVYRDCGLSPGAHVVVILQHGLDLYASYLGAIMGGFVPAMFAFPSAKQSEAEYTRTIGQLVANAGPALIVTYPALRALLGDVLPAAQREHIIIPPADIDELTCAEPWTGAQPDDTAFLQYSSGTTGLKKGVAISHRALLWQVRTYSSAIGLRSDDVIVSWLPLYHDMGLICCMFLPFLTGTALVSMSPFDWVKRPVLLFEAITRFRGTLCWLPNFAYNFLAKNVRISSEIDLSRLRGVINCSETVMADSHRRFVEAFRSLGLNPDALAVSYAMAESTFAVTSGGLGQRLPNDVVSGRKLAERWVAEPAPATDPDAKTLVSSGVPLPETEVMVVGADGVELGEREIGEIAVRSPSLLKEYHCNPEATAAAMRGGWLFTGDLGYQTGGHLFVTGRIKDLIIVAGKNLYPQDIEEIVNEVPGVVPGRVAAFGVSDEIAGTERMVIVAESVERDGARRGVIATAIGTAVATRTEGAAAEIRVVDHMWLVKSTSGKISRVAAREKYRVVFGRESHPEVQRNSNAATPLSFADMADDEAVRCVVQCIEHALQAAGNRTFHLDGNASLITSGLIDSLLLVTVIVQLEELVRMPIVPPFLEVRHFETPLRIVAMLRRLAGGRGVTDSTTREMLLEIDDRDKACETFTAQGEEIDLLILGSSKVQNLSPYIARHFGLKAFNFWVSSARAEDWYCILKYVLDHNRRKLRAVMLGIDVEAFSNAVGVEMRLLESSQLAPYLNDRNRGRAAGTGDARFEQILAQLRLGKAEPWAIKNAERAVPTDRYCLPGQAGHAIREPVRLKDPEDQHAQYSLRMKQYTELSDWRLAYFDRIAEICRAEGIALVTFTTQLHHALHQTLSRTTSYGARLGEIATRLEPLCRDGISYLHSPTVDAYCGYRDDFGDAAHIGRANADLLMVRLLHRAFRRPSLGSRAGTGLSPRVTVLRSATNHAAANDQASGGQGVEELEIRPVLPSDHNVSLDCWDWAAVQSSVRSARGEFLCFCSGNATWTPDKITRQAEFLDAHPDYAGVYCDFRVSDQLGGENTLMLARMAKPWGNDLFSALAGGGCFPSELVMLRSSVFRGSEAPPAVVARIGFYGLMLWLSARGTPLAFMDEPLVSLTVAPDDLSVPFEPLTAAVACLVDLVPGRGEKTTAALQRQLWFERKSADAAQSCLHRLNTIAPGSSSGGDQDGILLLQFLDKSSMDRGAKDQYAVWEVDFRGQNYTSLLLQPPAAIRFSVETGARGRFTASVALHPDVWTKRESMGCIFRVNVDGRAAGVVALDPARFAADRCWHDISLPVPENPNGIHNIVLETEGVGGTDYRWALWHRARFCGEKGDRGPENR